MVCGKKSVLWLMLAALVTVIVGVIVYSVSRSTDSAGSSDTNYIGSRVTSTLKFLIVVSRHGNRSPWSTYPSSPYQSSDRAVWPNGVEQLTEKGRVQMYNLGMKIRSMYNGFLNQTYYREDFISYTTLVDRTMMSGEAFLAGLFPPKGFQLWSDTILWQPIPLFPTYLDHQSLVDSPAACPRFQADQTLAKAECKEELGTNITSLLESIQNFTGLATPTSATVFPDLGKVWESIVYPKFDGLPLPDWVSSVYPEPLTTYIQKYFQAFVTATETMRRLLEGALFGEMASTMKAKVAGTLSPDRKMFYYSGHDYSLLGLQAILGMPLANIPVVYPGSALVLELHQDQLTNSSYYLQVLYLDGASTDLAATSLLIPDCGASCDFDVLMNKTEKYYNITNYDGECQNLTQT